MPALRPISLAAAASALAVALAVPAAAPADAVVGTVVGPAAQQGRTAVLPVLLAPAAARSHGGPVVRVAISGARPIRWGSDRLPIDRLRPGDRLGLRLAGRTAQVVHLRQSGIGDSFRRVTAALRRTGERSRGAIADLQPIVDGRRGDTGTKALRNRLSRLMAGLMGLKTDLGTSLDRLAAVGPAKGARHRAVRKAQRRYAARIDAVRRQAGVAARRTQAALTALGAGAPIGESGTQPVIQQPDAPAEVPGVVGAASQLSNSLVELLTQLGVLDPSGLSPVPAVEPAGG